MLKKLLFCIMLILSLQSLYAANVDVKTYIYRDSTIFNYIFEFSGNDSVSKFAIEKPADARLDYVVDKNGKINYDEAGDYYIIKVDDETSNTIYLKFTSKQTSEEIIATNSFRNYVNFNFEAKSLEYEVYFKEDMGEVIDVFPQNYQLYNSEKLRWVLNDVNQESLFIINFKDASETIEKKPINYTLILSIIIPIIVILIGILVITRKHKQLKKLEQKILDKEDKNVNKVSQQSPEEEEKAPIETFDDIVNKHLTENEKDIVMLIKDNEGISQYDILNHLPNLTKSNLSKIISKLHANRILKRIKVGKINNIYLGDKLSNKEKD